MNYYHVQDTEITVHRNGMEKRIFLQRNSRKRLRRRLWSFVKIIEKYNV